MAGYGGQQGGAYQRKTGTSLLGVDISNNEDATEVFGRCGAGVQYANTQGQTPIICMPSGGGGCSLYFYIPEGCFALVESYSRQKYYNEAEKNPIWPPGYYMNQPGTKVSHLVTKQQILFESDPKPVMTRDNVSVEIDFAIVFRILGDKFRDPLPGTEHPSAGGDEDGLEMMEGESDGDVDINDPALLLSFVQKLGPTSFQMLLNDAQEEEVRTLARQINHYDIFKLRSGGSTEDKNTYFKPDDMKRRLNGRFNKYGVQIVDISITNVKFSEPQIFKELSEKTIFSARDREQKMRHDFEMQQQKNREEIVREKQLGDESRASQVESGKKDLSDIRAENQALLADTRAMLADVNQSAKGRVQTIQAEGKLEVTRLEGEKNAVTKKLTSEARAGADKLVAETHANIQTMRATAELETTQLNGEAKKTIAISEGQAASMLRSKRQDELKHQQMEILSALATNPDVVITGDNGGNVLAQMVAAQRGMGAGGMQLGLDG